MSLYVDERGQPERPALIFLHGLGVSSWMWSDQLDALQDDYHCLAVDLPGNGASERTPWRTFEDSADQIAAFIRERAREGRAHVVGLSLGGYVAMHLLARHSEVVQTMIVSGITAEPYPKIANAMMRAMLPFVRSNIGLGLMTRLMQMDPEASALYQRDVRRMPPDVMRGIYDEVAAFSLEKLPALKERSQRLLVVAGEAEMKNVTEALSLFKATVPCGEAALVPKAHHTWNGEHPALFNAMVRAWVEGQPLPDALQIIEV